MMKKWIMVAALLAGIGIGMAVFRGAEHSQSQGGTVVDSASAAIRKSQRAPEAVGARISRMIASESTAMNENVPINQALDVLFAEGKSPLRTRAFLKNRVQMMSRAQLVEALENGDVQSEAELVEAARTLTKEDPSGVFEMFTQRMFRIHGMENRYAFSDALLQTWADADAPAVLRRLKQMKRGGSQQDNSLRFSAYWAKIAPAAAARNFNDLIYLRNMQDFGPMFTDHPYAEVIVNSWKQKDEAGMREYIGKLPSGRDKEAFEKALTKLDSQKRSAANE